MRRGLHWGLLLAGLAPSLSRTVRADDSVPEREAQARFEEGVARVKAGNIEGARMSFAQAYAVLHKPTILWNLALAEEKTGHPLEALHHFKELLRGSQSGDDRGNADKHVAALMAQTGHLDVAAPAGTQLLVDGAAVATLPLAEPVDVSAGRHHLEVHTGQGARGTDVDVGVGQLLRVSLLQSADAVTPTAAPASPAPSSTADESAERGGSATRVVAVVLGVTVAAVSVALGAYFALQTQGEANTAAGFRQQYGNGGCFNVTSPVCTEWNGTKQAQGRDASLSNAFYIAGGILAVGAVATWFLWPKEGAGADRTSATPSRRRGAALTWMPILGPAGAGFAASGRF